MRIGCGTRRVGGLLAHKPTEVKLQKMASRCNLFIMAKSQDTHFNGSRSNAFLHGELWRRPDTPHSASQIPTSLSPLDLAPFSKTLIVKDCELDVSGYLVYL